MNKTINKVLIGIIVLILTVSASFTYARYQSKYNSVISLNIRQPRYNIAFDANIEGSTGEMANQPFVYGTSQTLTGVGYTMDGYSFLGWNTMPDGTGIDYDDEAEIINLTTVDGATITLFAKWFLLGGYTVSYTGLAAGVTVPYSVDYNSGLSANFGSTDYAVLSVSMGDSLLSPGEYTFTNNTLVIPLVTGDVVVTLRDISGYEYAVDETETSATNPTQYQGLNGFFSNGGSTIVNGSIYDITALTIRLGYTYQHKNQTTIGLDVYLGTDGTTALSAHASQTMSTVSFSGTQDLVYNITLNSPIPSGSAFRTVYKMDNGNNQKNWIEYEIIDVVYADGISGNLMKSMAPMRMPNNLDSVQEDTSEILEQEKIITSDDSVEGEDSSSNEKLKEEDLVSEINEEESLEKNLDNEILEEEN